MPSTDILPAKQPSKSDDDEDDQFVVSFLQFMDKQMADHPEDIVAADEDQLHRIGKLVR